MPRVRRAARRTPVRVRSSSSRTLLLVEAAKRSLVGQFLELPHIASKLAVPTAESFVIGIVYAADR
jgi:hypothetical protein